MCKNGGLKPGNMRVRNQAGPHERPPLIAPPGVSNRSNILPRKNKRDKWKSCRIKIPNPHFLVSHSLSQLGMKWRLRGYCCNSSCSPNALHNHLTNCRFYLLPEKQESGQFLRSGGLLHFSWIGLRPEDHPACT